MKRLLFLFSKSMGGRLKMIISICVGLCILSFASAQARGPIMLGLGDSIGEGVQSADASLWTQPFSYLNRIANQIGVGFPLPWIHSWPFGMVGNTNGRSRILPSVASSNLAVSGADVNSLLNDRANALNINEINSETDLVLFPRLGSQIEIAESLRAPVIICWIGNNDVLSAVISFDELDASQMTPVEEFEAHFNEIAQRLNQVGKVIVFANIPDVSKIGFLVNGQDLIKFLGSDFGLGDGNYTSIVAMFLIKLGWDDGSLLQNPSFVLDASEVQKIQERIKAFNQIIERAANSINMPVVDINGLFDEISSNPPVFFGIPVIPRYLGGVFSLDGVHPSNIAHAMIANAFIASINANFNFRIPSISEEELEAIFLTDPFADKDGDGKVAGRPGAGLLETLAPLLGISGDKNDSVPDEVPHRSDLRLKEQFGQKYLSLKGMDPRMVSEWTKQDAIEAFKDIFRTRIFNKSVR